MIDERARKSTLSQRLIRCLFHDRSSVCGCSTSLLTDCEFLCNQWVTIFFWQDKLSIRNGKLIKQPPQGHLWPLKFKLFLLLVEIFRGTFAGLIDLGCFPCFWNPGRSQQLLFLGLLASRTLARVCGILVDACLRSYSSCPTLTFPLEVCLLGFNGERKGRLST